jgi:tRNA wybutosine-synthesizing protein 1
MQKKLLSGFGGTEKADMSKWKESKEPRHFAISLAGEPTIYPKLNELIKELHKQRFTTFVVSNGMLPDKLMGMEPPTQLYLSVDAPNEDLFRKIDQPTQKDGWQRLMQSLDAMKRLKKRTRTALRLTLIKGMNMVYPELWAELIMRAEPMFVEVKAYMFVGFSRQRLLMENMPLHNEVLDFAMEISQHCPYNIITEKKESRVVLMMTRDSSERILKKR